MQETQKVYNYLPKDALVDLAHRLDIPVSRVYSVATFFRAFTLEPRGRHIVSVCLGTACHVRGGVRVVEKLEELLKVPRGGTTPDLKFTVEAVNCIGACALGPNVIIDGESFGQMNAEKVRALIEKYN